MRGLGIDGALPYRSVLKLTLRTPDWGLNRQSEGKMQTADARLLSVL